MKIAPELEQIVDVVLAYRPERKTKAARKRKKAKEKNDGKARTALKGESK